MVGDGHAGRSFLVWADRGSRPRAGPTPGAAPAVDSLEQLHKNGTTDMRWLALVCMTLLVASLLLGSAVLGAALFMAALVAVHSCLAVARGLFSGRRADPDAGMPRLIAGVLAGAAASLAVGLILSHLPGHAVAWPAALVGFGLPLGCVTGWQVAAAYQSLLWANQRHALVLGQVSEGPFAIARPFTVTPAERVRHLVCCGATGSGKSTLIRNLVLQDLRHGHGLCVIDPKDDLVDGILPHIPEARIDDVILFDITDRERPLSLNPLAGIAPAGRSLAAGELISVFRRYFGDAWGARLEHVLRNVILALLEVPGASLADVPRLLLDSTYRDWALQQVTNQAVREFFVIEFEQVLRRRSDAIEPILNKVGPWLSYPELRLIVGQSESSFDMRQVMDQGKVLLVRIPQGAFGEDISNLLGSLLVAKLQLAAQSRVDLPAAARRPFYLYVDEFQNFATSSFAKIASESRAFRLGICAANQYPEQLPRDLQLALRRNAATFVQATYRRGRYLLEVTRQEDLGDEEPPVFLVTPPQPLGEGDRQLAQRVRTHSRRRYGLSLERQAQPGRGQQSGVGTGSRRLLDLDEQ